jgi:integrase
MAIYKQKGSNVLWYEFQFDGVRYRKSAKTTSKKVAEDAMKAHRRELEEGFNGIKKRVRPKLFSEAAAIYLIAKEATLAKSSMRIERRLIGHLLAFFGKIRLVDITPTHIKEFKDARLAAGAAPRGVNMQVGTLRAILRRNHLWENLRPDVSWLRGETDFGKCLSLSEEDRLLAQCRISLARYLYTVVVLALCTGMRSDEIRLLRWKQINLKEAFLRVGHSKTKNGTGRIVPLNNSALKTLTDWASNFPDRLPEHFVFAYELCTRKRGGVMIVRDQDPTKPIGCWAAAFTFAKKRAGVQARFHDLRHTAVTRMVEADIPLPKIGEIVGWSAGTLALMIKRYSHMSNSALRKVVSSLEIGSISCPSVADTAGRVERQKAQENAA